MTRVQRATLKVAAFILATLSATGALVAAGLNEDDAQARIAVPTCVANCR